MVNPLLQAFGVSLTDLPDQRTLSRAFNPYIELTHDAADNDLNSLLDDLCAERLTTGARKPGKAKQQNLIDCMQLILTNLIQAHTIDPITTVGIARGKGQLSSERRYNPEFMTVDYFLRALDLLTEKKLIELVSLGYQNDGLAEVSRYKLGNVTKATLALHEFSPSSFRVGQCRETVRLKDNCKRLTGYKDSPEIVSMRTALDKINTVLAVTDIDTSKKLSTVTDVKEGFDPDRKSLYRVFNDSSFEHGGRFNGGWWQYVKKHVRPLITLNGLPTVEADFKGMFPSMLFAQRGLSIPDDPYELVPHVRGNPILRDHAKTTFNALLNSTSVRTDEPKDFDEQQHDMTPEKFRHSVRNAYPMLPGIFGKGAGLILHRLESDIAETVMLHFVNQGLPILPIHDAFILPIHLTDELVSVMKATFEQKFGQVPQVDVKRGLS